MSIVIRLLTDEDYDAVSALWNAAEQSRRALNPVDDTREGIYARRGHPDRPRRPPRPDPPPLRAPGLPPRRGRRPPGRSRRRGAAAGGHPEDLLPCLPGQRRRQRLLGAPGLFPPHEPELPQQKPQPRHPPRRLTPPPRSLPPTVLSARSAFMRGRDFPWRATTQPSGDAARSPLPLCAAPAPLLPYRA